ncbi:MAG: glycosyltransferase family 4 protein [Deltaproteobacteria bacterium]|nr:glycosyltransferase family 4 protein [Deltaproteobacteria bacterium]
MSELYQQIRTLIASVIPARGGASGAVTHLLPSVGWGGNERLACTLHRLAQEGGWRSRMDAPMHPRLHPGLWEDGGADSDESQQFRSQSSALSDTQALVAWARAARRRAKIERPAVVHAHLAWPDRAGLALYASAGAPLVLTFGLLPAPNAHYSSDELLRWRSDNVLANVHARLSRVWFVAPSEADAARLCALVGPRASARVRHIANCAPLPRVHRKNPQGFRWPEDTLRVLTVARLVPQKGLSRALEAMAHPSLRALRWHWLIAGEGELQRALRAQVSALGLADRVTFAGDLRADALYPDADVLLSTSHTEGFALVPLEAIEAGCPVLLSPIVAHHELLGAHTPEALLPRDETQWPDALLSWFLSRQRLKELALQQGSILAQDPRAATREAYDLLYREVARCA